MIEDQNPFIHPAQIRFQELLNEAEEQVLTEQETQPLSDPLERYHVAEEWGVDPWVAAMIETSQALVQLKALAVSVAPDSETAKQALMAVATRSLQALVLYEETEHGDPVLDDQQLANFLDKLRDQLDARIEKLRQSKKLEEEDQIMDRGEAVDRETFVNEHRTSQVPSPDEDWAPTTTGESQGMSVGIDAPPGFVKGVTYGEQELDKLKNDTGGEDDTARPFLNESATRPITTVESEDVPLPDQDQVDKDFNPPHALSPDDEPVDLNGANRALAREVAALRQVAGGSSAADLGGRHASPANTDPDLGATGRRAKGEEE